MPDITTPDHLLLVSRSMPPDVGGYQRQFATLVRYLAERFKISWIGAVRDPNGGRDTVDISGARRVAIRASWIPRRIRGVADLWVVVVACGWLLWARVCGRCGVVLLLSPTMIGGSTLVRLASKLGWRTGARFPSRGDQLDRRGRRVGILTSCPGIVPSRGQLEEQLDFSVVDVPNSVVTPHDHHRHARTESGTFLFVGRLVRDKRPDIILAAWREVCDELPGWSLHVVGDGGSQRDSIEQQMRRTVRAQSVPRCTFYGSVSEPIELMADADVFVFPSLSEGLPNCMLEALACGLPVIADPKLAQTWFGRSVPLLPWDGEAGSLASAMRLAADDPSQRRRTGQAGTEFTAAHHGPEMISQRLADVLLAGDGGRCDLQTGSSVPPDEPGAA